VQKTVSKAVKELGGARALALSLGLSDARTVEEWLRGERSPQQRYVRDIKIAAGETTTWRDTPRQELAKELGVDPKTVALWQSGLREMPNRHREALENGGGTLRGWRRAHGMSREDVAAMAGVHPDTVTRWETRNARVSPENHHKLIKMAGSIAVEWWPLSDTEKLRRLLGWSMTETAECLGVSRKRAAAWASKGGEPAWVKREINNLRAGGSPGIPSLLRRRRRKLGLSVKEIADSLGVSQATVRGWERGEDLPHKNRTSDVAEAYGLKTEDLIRREAPIRGSSVRKWREEIGITQREAALRLNVSLATVSRWESGRGRPGPNALESLLCLGWSGL
jgi:transcriptional regulator with XRE-family HTH domain